MLDRRFLVVTGKGGVGKTVVASAIAASAAARGKRVLLCDLDCTGDVGRCFGTELGYEPTTVRSGLAAMELDLEAAVVDYIHTQARMGFAARLGPISRTLAFVANSAPGVREVLSIGKLLNELRDERYDLVVMDGPASGHVVGFLRTPATVGTLTGAGVVGRQSAWMTEMLADPACTGAVVVATPEELPVREASELVASLDAADVDIAGLVVNRLRGRTLTPAAESLLRDRLDDSDGPAGILVGALAEAIDLRRIELDRARRFFATAVTGDRCSIPQLRLGPGDLVDAVADVLGAEW